MDKASLNKKNVNVFPSTRIFIDGEKPVIYSKREVMYGFKEPVSPGNYYGNVSPESVDWEGGFVSDANLAARYMETKVSLIKHNAAVMR